MFYLQKQKAFTLIEMLIVISIICVLAALLMPALHKAVYHARDVSCLNQQRQVGRTAIAYSDDYYGFLPFNDAHGTHLYFPADNYNLSGRIINKHYTGLGLLYGLSYTSDARLFWCGNEDEPGKQNASGHKTNGYRRLASATPPAYPSQSVGTDYWYRCGWWTSEKNDLERLVSIKSPANGLIMCGSKGSSGRISWQELHQGRGFCITFAGGNGQFFSYERYLTPDLWASGNYYNADDFPKKTLTYASTLARDY